MMRDEEKKTQNKKREAFLRPKMLETHVNYYYYYYYHYDYDTKEKTELVNQNQRWISFDLS